jgi:signal transduction histidine kinase
LELATQELDRVTHITKQTLAFNREDKTPILIDLRASIDSILKLYAPRLQAREITVEKRYAEVECIRAGGGEIQQVISNLLSNSMDATPNRGKIELRVSRSIGRDGTRLVRFTIADTGSGIPPERLKKIFEPFFTTKEIVGTGLGLWVTKQIVEKYGATIRVRSKVGRGAVFSIAFPVAEGTKQARRKKGSA